jgi:outer membrane protein TolC
MRELPLAARQGPPFVVLVVAAMACVSVVHAQEPLTLRLTLEDAQTRALQTSHRLAELRARERAADAVIEARLAMDRPVVAAIAGYTRTNHVTEFSVPGPTGVPRVLYPDVPDNYRGRLDLQWPIYTGGRTDALERVARADAAAVGAEASAARADLRLEVARAFWALVTARASVGVLQQAVARAEAHTGDVRQRFNAGLVPPNETASAEAQASRTRMLMIEARNQRDAASADLARLIGADTVADIEPTATLDTGVAAGPENVGAAFRRPIEETPPTLPQLTAEARSSRYERRAFEQRIEAADAQRAAAAAGRRPTLALAAGLDYGRPNPRIFPRADRWEESWDAGVHLSWSLWDGGRTAADTAQAAAAAVAARERLAEFDSVLAVELRHRTLEIESGRAAVDAAADGLRAASEARRVVAERYRAGVIAQGEVLDAELALLQAELDRTRALAGVRLAEARLARATGR